MAPSFGHGRRDLPVLEAVPDLPGHRELRLVPDGLLGPRQRFHHRGGAIPSLPGGLNATILLLIVAIDPPRLHHLRDHCHDDQARPGHRRSLTRAGHSRAGSLRQPGRHAQCLAKRRYVTAGDRHDLVGARLGDQEQGSLEALLDFPYPAEVDQKPAVDAKESLVC
jgi:hypothetical protein